MTPWLSFALSLAAVAAGIIIMRRIADRRSGSDAVLEEIRREIGAILTEMNQTTERNIELVEDSIQRLRSVLDDADRRLAVLNRETRKQKNSGVVYSHLSAAAKTRPAPEAVASATPVSPPTITSEPEEAPQTVVPTSAEANDVSLKDRVLGLYRQGIPIERIAAKVGTAVSEIELIVSLSERR